MSRLFRKLSLWLLLLPLAVSPGFAAEKVEYFSQDRLEQLVAPIAIYPDALVAQVLMASTYPLQVAQAARWQKRYTGLKDEPLDRAAQGEPWDPSVKSLLHFPDLLNRMSENLDWTKDLGDAVLAQQPAVMEAVQRLRRYAYDAGNLQNSEQQRVVVDEQVIRVEPATEVVYVPTYNPTVVYGRYWAPSNWYYPLYGYPSAYWYPYGYNAASVVAFGIGVFAAAAIWGDLDWHHGWIGYHDYHPHWYGGYGGGGYYGDRDVIINNFYGPRTPPVRWEHNPVNRRGVAYRDPAVAQRFEAVRRNGPRGQTAGGPPRPGAGGARPDSRGYDMMGRRAPTGATAPGQRPGAMAGRPDSAGPGQRPAPGSTAGPRDPRGQTQTAPGRGSQDQALSGPGSTPRAAAQPSRSGAGGGSQPPRATQGSRGAPQRGDQPRTAQPPRAAPGSQGAPQRSEQPRAAQPPRATQRSQPAQMPSRSAQPAQRSSVGAPTSRPSAPTGGGGFNAPQAQRSMGAPRGPSPGGSGGGPGGGNFSRPGGAPGGHR